MNEWEREIQKLIVGTGRVPHRYELRPGLKSPYIYCTTCGTKIAEETTVYIDEIVDEAMVHEKNTHPRSS